jgi:FixJ family two-component response regulator
VINVPVITIVDDDPSVCRALRRLVQSRGYTVQTFASADEFLATLARSRPACLILDVHLDGMNGVDLHERLAAAGTGIPVIFITAHDDAWTLERMELSGAAGYLRKPVDEATLLDAIRRVVGTRDEGPIGRPGDVD